MKKLLSSVFILITFATLATNALAFTPSTTSSLVANAQPTYPIRAAFYYPWFPEAWKQQGIYPYTRFTPSLNYYDSSDQATIRKHIDAMQYGNIEAGIVSWWGPGTRSDSRVPTILSASSGNPFRWGFYHEQESLGDPSVASIQADLTYLRDSYGNNPNVLRVDGRFVVFVYSDGNDACGMADRWKRANTVGAYVVLKVFVGYKNCASQPDSWHQYSPAKAVDSQGIYSYAISPGFYQAGQSLRLGRDLTRWTQNVRDMNASPAQWQLVTTFNEWGEGTIVESAKEWASASGYGAYLDALHAYVPAKPGTPPVTAVPTTPPTATSVPTTPPTATSVSTAPPAPSQTVAATSTPPSVGQPVPTATAAPVAPTTPGSSTTFSPIADMYVTAEKPANNGGNSTTLRADASPDMRSYLRFNVQGLSGSIVNAQFRVYSKSKSSVGYQIRSVNSSEWYETTTIYGNAPSVGAVVGNSGPYASGAWTSVDVTSLIKGNGTIDVALTTSSMTAVSFASREEPAYIPQLIIQTSGTAAKPAPVGTASPSSTPIPPQAPSATTVAPTTAPAQSGAETVLVGAGDIATCSRSDDEAVANLIDKIPGTVFTLGDNVYDSGTAAEFANCYDPSWGRFKARTRPAPGNHEYLTAGGAAYFSYFGANAGQPGKGYYSYNRGAWHIIVINSTCSEVGGCGTNSPQVQWLRADLAANPTSCTLAYWHHPRYSSGQHGSFTAMQPIWQALYDANAELVLSGHDHNYERFAPQNATGGLDLQRGIRQFVVGTGGKNHYPMQATIANSEVRNDDTFGVMKLTLKPNGYDWQFVPQAGKTFTDSGSGTCH